MSTRENLAEWLRSMGLPNVNPQNLASICNPSTALIWEQLIANTKAKQEVEGITKNIVINRLQAKPLEQQGDFLYAIKELEVYLKKEKLRKSKSVYEKSLQESDGANEELMNRNKKKYVLISCLKETIKEYQKKTYLLEKKHKLIEEDLSYVESLIQFIDNKSHSTEDIDEELEKCVTKLKEISNKVREPEKISHLNRSLLMSSASFSSNTPTSSLKKSTSTLKYFSKTETPMASKSRRQLYEDQLDKENRSLNTSDFLDLTNTFEDVFLTDDSFLSQKSVSKCQAFSSCIMKYTPNQSSDMVEKFYNNSLVVSQCKHLLRTQNRNSVVNSCCGIKERSIMRLHQLSINSPKRENNSNQSDEETLCELYYRHVKYELEALGFKSRATELQNSIKSLKSGASSPSTSDKVKLIIEDVKLDAALNFITKYTKSASILKTALDLRTIHSNINQTTAEMSQRLNSIEELITNIHLIMSSIQDKKREAIERINRMFLHDSMAPQLADQVFTKEIELFERYPLVFNHECRNENTSFLSYFPAYIDWTSHNMQDIVSLMESPFTPIECLLVSFIKTNLKCQKFRTLQGFHGKLPQIDYPLEEVAKSNKRLEQIRCDFCEHLESPIVTGTLSCYRKMQELSELWLNMPFGNYISAERAVNGHDYKFYEKKFDRCCHDL